MLEAFERMPRRKLEALPSSRSTGTLPDDCLEPETIEDLSVLLETASVQRAGVLIVGGATRLDWAHPAAGIAFGVSTRALSGVDVFEPDEGVLHARAGTPVAEVQSTAREAGWELPLDPPGSSSTIGGTIATAATGPRAQTFGRVADAILGLEVVGADGTPSKCGGRVVKNVTGYDLAKLYCGSFGSLGVLTGAWLRLRPLPARTLALRARLPAEPVGFDVCRELSRLTSVRAAIWIEGENADADEGVYFELGGSDAEVAHDFDAIESCLATQEIESVRIDALRDARASSQGSPIALRARVLPVDGQDLVRRLRDAGLVVAADLGIGVAHARGAVDSEESLVALRRAAVERGGLMVFEALPEAWRGGVDVFGESSANADLALALKKKFDPHGILNPERFGPRH